MKRASSQTTTLQMPTRAGVWRIFGIALLVACLYADCRSRKIVSDNVSAIQTQISKDDRATFISGGRMVIGEIRSTPPIVK